MTAKTNKERIQEHRKRQREAGLKPLEVWAQPEHHAAIKAFVKSLTHADKARSHQSE